jgi:hypothetical protein
MNVHLAVLGQTGKPGCWATILRDYTGTWSVLSAGGVNLDAVFASALAVLRDNPGGDFSFSVRTIADLVDQPLVEDEDELQHAVPGASITVFCPEGGPGDGSLWNSLWRDPTMRLSSPGPGGRYRLVSLLEQVQRWLMREDVRTFEPARISERFDLQPPVRPPFIRELLVRGAWSARSLVPDAFPSLALLEERRAKQAETQAQYEALRRGRDPREKTRLMQEQYARDRELLGVSAEERARRELERKATFGKEVREPSP